MKKHVLFMAGILALAGGSLCAETTYTVDSAAESALQNNITVERSKLQLDSLKRKSGISWNGALPSLSAGAGISRSITDTAFDDATSAYGSIGASVSVSAGLVASMRDAKLDYEAGLISYESAARSVELSVRKAFFNLLYARKNVELLESNLATAQKQYEQTLANQKVGLASDLEVLSARVSLENVRPNLSSAKVTLLNDLSSFREMIGVDDDGEIALAGSLDDAIPQTDIDLSNLTIQSADVAAAEKALEAARLARQKASLAAWSPTLSLSLNYKTQAADLAEGAWTKGGALTAAVSVPLDGILPWSASNASVDSAEETVKDLELRLASAATSSDLAVQSLLRKIDQSRATITARALNVTLAEKSYAMTEEAYRRGTKDLLSLQAAADSLRSAKLLLMQETYTLASAVLDLEYAIGVPFGTLGR